MNEPGEYELLPYEQIPRVGGGNPSVQAFVFEREGKHYVVYWHVSGEANVEVSLAPDKVRLLEELGKEMPLQPHAGKVRLPAGKCRYLELNGMTRQEVITAFQNTKILSSR